MGMQDDKDGRMLRTHTHASEMQWLKKALKDDRDWFYTPANNLLFTPTSASGMYGSQSEAICFSFALYRKAILLIIDCELHWEARFNNMHHCCGFPARSWHENLAL